MPTKTFFNLPEEKRRKLVDAIRAEFSRVPVEAVSINQIIKTAGIPRGSFYQYFVDKQDMLQYLLADYKQMVLRHATESLKASGGDLFAMFMDILDFTYAFVSEETNNAFCKNVFSDIRVNTRFWHREIGGEAFGGFGQMLLPHVDMGRLDIQSAEDFNNMLGILLPITGEAFARVFFDMSTYPDVRKQYAARLGLLERGFLKNKTTKAG